MTATVPAQVQLFGRVRATKPGYRKEMTDEEASDVLAEDEVVQVPVGTEELAESQDPGSTYLPDVPNWDEPDEDTP